MAEQMPIETPVVETEKPESDPVLSALEGDETSQEETLEAEPEGKTDDAVEKEETEEEDETLGEEKEESEDETTPDGELNKEQEEEELDSKELARRGYEERQRIRKETKERIQQQGEKYIENAEDDTERRLRTVEVQEYERTVLNNQSTLVGEYDRVKANPDLQIFNKENKEQFNEKLWDSVLKDYNAGYLEHDENGNLVQIKGSLYQYLTEKAELYQEAVKSGAFQQVKATRKMSNKADTKPAAPPQEGAPKDPILDVLNSD